MSHFAKIVNGIVTQVIVAEADFFTTFVDTSPGTWVQTSFNTRGGKHYNPVTGIENTSETTPALRGNYAGIGYTYDSNNDVFYAPQPFPSWILNKSTWSWESPIPYPNDGNVYIWDETKKSWVETPKA